MIIHIEKRTCPYVQIDNRVLEDDRLSWKAKGLLCYLLSRRSDWCVRRDDLINRSTDGRESVQAGMQELKECGYAALLNAQGEDGKTMGMQWLVVEHPEMLESTLGRLSRSKAETLGRENPSKVKSAHNNTREDNNTDQNNYCSKASQAEQIYKAYPRRVGKKAALDKIEKALRKIPFQDLLATVRLYAESRKGKPEKFTPYPGKWFGHGRYEDDPEVWMEGRRPKVEDEHPDRAF